MADSNILFDALIEGRGRSGGQLLETVDGQAIGDAAFLDRSARFATVLVDAGVSPGDRVAVQVEKSVDALALYVACLQCGGVFLPLNTAYTEAELDYFVADAEPSVLVLDPAHTDCGERLAAGNAPCLLTLGSDRRGSLPTAAEEADPMVNAKPRSGSDLAAILYTSGTTGRSKGAMLTHDNLLSNARTLVDAWAFTPDDVLVHALPIFHTHGLFVACNVVLLAGARLIFLPRFDVDVLLNVMPRASVLMGVPTYYTRLLDSPAFTRETAASMRLFISGSAPLLADTHRAFEARTGQRILERYGMTETSMSCSNPYDGERKAGTVGLPLPGVEVRIRDAQGAMVASDEPGVLSVRGPNVFAGYWRMPDKTAEELGEDGWFVTGDLAAQDTDGYVTIVGRDKDLIIAGGLNIYPKEIELVIDALDGVIESAVVAAPHADLGEAVVAFVVRSDDATGRRVDCATIIDGCARKLARFKQPRAVRFVEQLPRNTMGKVQKSVLRDSVQTAFGG